VNFNGSACGALARAKCLDLFFLQGALAERLEQLKTVGETHVPNIIAGLAEFL
jgi:hypothetical protein